MTFSKEERAAIVAKIQRYFVDELESSIGVMPAELLVEFLAQDIGAFYYNRGLADAQAVFTRKLDEVADALYALEQREARTR
jgi:uncharacterized protein (DUF2164 family)